ncbi:hypothetical protein HY493_02970 [Candidatus Woesearchaeota archaeon]|nr:hypothetical protein [Candidatus Woesearchaeota archaeon]
MPKKAVKRKSAKVPSKKGKSAPVTDDEPIEKKESHEDADDYDLEKEDYADKIKKGEAEEDVYTDEGRDLLHEDDEIDDMEEGFSKGAQPDKHHKR